MLEPGHVETFIAYLQKEGHFDEAASRWVEVLNNPDFVSINSKSRHQQWMELCLLIAEHPKEVKSIKIEPIIRQGISKFKDEVRTYIVLDFS
jgi:pre-mRNA-splicing factor SYF1